MTPEQRKHFEYVRDEMHGEQAQKQEPVAFMFQHDEVGRCVFVPNDSKDPVGTFLQINPRYHLVGPLYTSPPQRQWVGLSIDEVFEMASGGWTLGQMAVLVEAKLKEKNT